jgi:hypothetical protein
MATVAAPGSAPSPRRRRANTGHSRRDACTKSLGTWTLAPEPQPRAPAPGAGTCPRARLSSAAHAPPRRAPALAPRQSPR